MHFPLPNPSRPCAEFSLRRASVLLIAALAFSLLKSEVALGENQPPHAVAEHSGVIPAGNATAFILAADLGSVQIQALPVGAAPEVRYSVHLETDARQPAAQALLEKYSLAARQTAHSILLSSSLPPTHSGPNKNAQFWVQFTITVPENFSVEVTTGAGDIETSNIGGRAVLLTEGGNIRTGRIGFSLAPADGIEELPSGTDPLGRMRHEHHTLPPLGEIAARDRLVAKLQTRGGHITLLDIAGDVDAYTAGGHIQAGNISGNAKLRTGGGHIRAGKIRGSANLETEGGQHHRRRGGFACGRAYGRRPN